MEKYEIVGDHEKYRIKKSFWKRWSKTWCSR